MLVYFGFYSVLFIFSLFYLYLLRFKMKANGVPQDKIKKRMIVFFCSFWGIIISLSSVAYGYHVLELNMYLVLFLVITIALFIFLGIRRVNQWINEPHFI